METKNIGLYWLTGIGVVLLCVIGWFMYWNLALKGADNRYEVNRNTQ